VPSPSTTVFTVLVLMAATARCSVAQGNGSNHSQNIQTNNGVSVQLNIQQNLRKAAAASQLDEHGWMRLLTPAHEEPPSSKCSVGDGPFSIPPTALRVFYGTNVAYCMPDGCDVVAGRRGTTTSPLITVRKVKTGILLDVRVFDKDGNIIASIVGDKPHLNRNFVSDFNRPDEHSLWIKDNHDEQVLYVKLLNSTTLYLEGVFNLPNDVRGPSPTHTSLTISKDYAILKPGMRFAGSCMGLPSKNGAVILLSEGN
jgi:hypothetical protein